MKTTLTVSPEIKDRLQNHLREGEVLEDVVLRLLDLDDKYGDSKPLEFEVNFDDRVIKVFRLNNTQVEYFTPARKFSISLSDWNLPSEFSDDWIGFVTSSDAVSALLGLGDGILECGCFMIRQI